MRARRRVFHSYVCSVMALCILLYPALSLAQNAGSPSAPGAPAKQPAAIKQPAVTAASAPATRPVPQPDNGTKTSYTVVVHLRVDGNLAGRLSMIDPSGKRIPARANVSFLQNGQVVASAQSDEFGRFQVTGLRPGVYSVIASGPDGFAAVSVQVLPFAADASKEQVTLELTLVPLGDTLSDMLAGETTAAAATTPSGATGGSGGGGGGGGGFGLLAAGLGIAGLSVGIAALAEKKPASPVTP